MSRITLNQANAIIAGAFAKAQELALKPLGVVVLDAGGHLIACQRQDGASTGRLQLAPDRPRLARTDRPGGRGPGSRRRDRGR